MLHSRTIHVPVKTGVKHSSPTGSLQISEWVGILLFLLLYLNFSLNSSKNWIKCIFSLYFLILIIWNLCCKLTTDYCFLLNFIFGATVKSFNVVFRWCPLTFVCKEYFKSVVLLERIRTAVLTTLRLYCSPRVMERRQRWPWT